MPDVEVVRLKELLAGCALRHGTLMLSSGIESDVYVDAKAVTYHPDGAELVGQVVFEQIRDYSVAGIGGLTLGADAIVSQTIVAARRAGETIPGFIVRKIPKTHGLEKQIEGVRPEPGSRVAIVDDVVTSGGSVILAIEKAAEAGLVVSVVVALVDREQGGREALGKRGIPYRPICTLSELLEYEGPHRPVRTAAV